uniref:Uncharacterized protein n=1 Tax=Micrurus spixii TaxID=129469 RepID=A0A2D4MK43_9SAUR
MSSCAAQKPICFWPRPMVYFPDSTPSYFSNSLCSTYWNGKYTSRARIPTSLGHGEIVWSDCIESVEKLQDKSRGKVFHNTHLDIIVASTLLGGIQVKLKKSEYRAKVHLFQ